MVYIVHLVFKKLCSLKSQRDTRYVQNVLRVLYEKYPKKFVPPEFMQSSHSSTNKLTGLARPPEERAASNDFWARVLLQKAGPICEAAVHFAAILKPPFPPEESAAWKVLRPLFRLKSPAKTARSSPTKSAILKPPLPPRPNLFILGPNSVRGGRQEDHRPRLSQGHRAHGLQGPRTRTPRCRRRTPP